MATYTKTTGPVQEAAITAKRLKATEAGGDFSDNAAFVDHAIDAMLQPIVAEFIEARLQLVADAYRTAPASARATVDEALGL
ncbi:MAG: hypothetical protein GEV06_19780 [Luteitalea sp.]|nr:hypothetical protein [Luteitalea sp.]